jgi:hypothetical protein
MSGSTTCTRPTPPGCLPAARTSSVMDRTGHAQITTIRKYLHALRTPTPRTSPPSTESVPPTKHHDRNRPTLNRTVSTVVRRRKGGFRPVDIDPRERARPDDQHTSEQLATKPGDTSRGLGSVQTHQLWFPNCIGKPSETFHDSGEPHVRRPPRSYAERRDGGRSHCVRMWVIPRAGPASTPRLDSGMRPTRT